MASQAISVTRHAIDRFRERVEDLPDSDICECLASPAVEGAARLGAPFVRLPGRQRIVPVGFTVVTVLPSECPCGLLDRRRKH